MPGELDVTLPPCPYKRSGKGHGLSGIRHEVNVSNRFGKNVPSVSTAGKQPRSARCSEVIGGGREAQGPAGRAPCGLQN